MLGGTTFYVTIEWVDHAATPIGGRGEAYAGGGEWIQGECHPYAAEQAWDIRAEDKPIADQNCIHDPPRAI